MDVHVYVHLTYVHPVRACTCTYICTIHVHVPVQCTSTCTSSSVGKASAQYVVCNQFDAAHFCCNEDVSRHSCLLLCNDIGSGDIWA